MNFFLMYFKISYDSFLGSEFVNGFPCRVKITILTTLSGFVGNIYHE